MAEFKIGEFFNGMTDRMAEIQQSTLARFFWISFNHVPFDLTALIDHFFDDIKGQIHNLHLILFQPGKIIGGFYETMF